MSLLAHVLLIAALGLSQEDSAKLAQYDTAWSRPTPAMRMQVRREFSGRGAEIAEYFLAHSSPPPHNGAYFFALRELAEPDAALVLIRALSNWPPAGQDMPRFWGEIEAAASAALIGSSVQQDARIVPALLLTIERASSHPVQGPQIASAGVRLLGQVHTSAAVGALQKLLSNPQPELRAAAAQALATADVSAPGFSFIPRSVVESLSQTLVSDPNWRARRDAAISLGRLHNKAAEGRLLASLRTEQQPEVVDAILGALRVSGVVLQDPRLCFTAMQRAHEASVAEPAFACWRRAATPSTLLDTALRGPAIPRVLATMFLIREAQPPPRSVDRYRKAFPPSPAAARPGDQQAMVSAPVMRFGGSAQDPPHFTPELRNALLRSMVEALSQNESLGDSTTGATQQALWEISGHDMASAIASADQISGMAARFQMSEALSRFDAGAYFRYRRRRQALLAAGIAALMLVMALASGVRRSALICAVAAAGWACASLYADSVRELPPPPLQLLSVSAIGFLCGGAVAAAFARFRSPGTGYLKGVLYSVGAAGSAGLVAAIVCGSTRNSRLFPVGTEGWELIFDPAGAFIVATAVALLLAALDVSFPRREPT